MARTHQYPAVSMIRWSSVVAGAVVGVAVMALLTSFFLALGSETTAIADNLHWYGFLSAVVALFVAGLLAGGLSRERGIGTGILHGVTAWGLVLVVALAFPFPQAFGLLELFTTPAVELGTGPLWAAFLSLVVGLVVAAIGGLIGGMITRPMIAPGAEYEAGREGEAGRPYDADRGHDGGRGYNGGRAYEGERGYPDRPARTEPVTDQRTRQEPAPGRRRR